MVSHHFSLSFFIGMPPFWKEQTCVRLLLHMYVCTPDTFHTAFPSLPTLSHVAFSAH